MRALGVWLPFLAAAGLAVGCTGTSVQVLGSPGVSDSGMCVSVEAGPGLADASTSDAANMTSGPEAGSAEAAPAGDAATAAQDGGRGPHGGTWPVYAHDQQRTARADGTGQMTHPTVAWTNPMGSTLQVGEAAVGDSNGDGRPDAVTLHGGRVICSTPDGSTLWQGPLDGSRTVLGIWNLDGVGTPEVVIDSSEGVRIVNGATGQSLTLLPTTGASQATFAAVGQQGGILMLQTSGGSISAYDFRAGTHVTAAAWTSAGSDDQVALAVGDVDGDGAVDVVRPRNDGFEVLDPITGTTKYSDRPVGPIAYFYDFQLANVDSSPGLEIVATDTSYIYSPSAGMYVLGVRNGALTTLWSTTVSATVAHAVDLYTVDGAVADLDGDGTKELVYSQWDGAAQSWTTHIASASSGAPIASIAGQIVQALADVDGDGKVEIAVRASPRSDMRPTGTTLSVYDFDSAAAGPVAKSWTLASAHVVDQASSVFVHDRLADVPAIADFDPATPGLELLVGVNQAPSGADTAIKVLRGDGSIASTLAAAANVTPSVLWWGNGLTSATSTADVLTFGTDGTARALDHTLHQAVSFPTGSYSNWLGVLGLDETHNVVTMATSEQQMLGLDGTRLHSDGTPYQVLRASGVVDTSGIAAVGWPLAPVALLASAFPTLVHYEQGKSGVTLVGTDSIGVEIWRTPLAAGASVFSPGPYTYDFTGDGYPDLLLQIEDINQQMSLAIFDGTTGALVRSTPLQTVAAGADLAIAGSLVDVNGDGHPDLAEEIQNVGMIAIDLSASPMAKLWKAPNLPVPYYLGTVAAVAVDGTGTSLLRVGAAGPYARYSLSGSLLASNDEGLAPADNETNSVAFVKRAGTQVFDMVAAGTSGAGLSRVRRIAGDTLAPGWTVYAAGGVLSASQPSPSFAMREPLTLDVDGDGTEEVVVGSDDGWLYAIHAADGTLLFSVNLGAPVSHVVAGDVDLDPATELLASLADGRLVALDDQDKYTATRDVSQGDAGAGNADAGGGADAGSGADAGPSPDASSVGDAGFGPCVPAGAAPPATHVSCALAAPGGSAASSGGALAACTLLAGTLARRRRRRRARAS